MCDILFRCFRRGIIREQSSKCSHFCTNVYSLYMWMFFKLVSEKHDFSFFNNYSLSGGGFVWKNVKYGLLEVFERGILTKLCLYMIKNFQLVLFFTRIDFQLNMKDPHLIMQFDAEASKKNDLKVFSKNKLGRLYKKP